MAQRRNLTELATLVNGPKKKQQLPQQQQLCHPNDETFIDALLSSQSQRPPTIMIGGTPGSISPAILEYTQIANNVAVNNSNNTINQNITINTDTDTMDLQEAYHAKYDAHLASVAARYEFSESEEEDSLFSFDEEDPASSSTTSKIPLSQFMQRGGEDNDASRASRKRPRSQRGKSVSIKEECFLCSVGDKFHDGIRVPHISKLFEMMSQGYGTMSNHDLALAMHVYYKNVIYNAEEGTVMLETYMIMEHLEGRHSLAAENFIVESIRDYEQMKFLARLQGVRHVREDSDTRGTSLHDGH
jgi:hypothetical protein